MISQISFFVFIAAVVVSNRLLEFGVHLPFVAPDLHGICPFGAVATFGRLITEGRFITHTGSSNLWILAGLLVATAVAGPTFCGTLCPLGAVQDWVGALGRKIFGKQFSVPRGVDKALSYLRYAVLILVVIQTTRLVNLVFTAVDPYYALFNFWTGSALPSALAVLAAVLVASLFVARPWCRWLCPLGGLLGIVGYFAPITVRRNTQTCNNCTLCSRACPMGIDVGRTTAVRDSRCTRCGRCVAACRRRKALYIGAVRGPSARPIPLPLLALVTAVLVVAPPLIARAVVDFGHTPTGTTAASVVQVDVETIAPQSTIAEVAELLAVPLETVLGAIGLPVGYAATTKLFDIEIDEEFEHLTMREIRRRLAMFLENRYDGDEP